MEAKWRGHLDAEECRKGFANCRETRSQVIITVVMLSPAGCEGNVFFGNYEKRVGMQDSTSLAANNHTRV